MSINQEIAASAAVSGPARQRGAHLDAVTQYIHHVPGRLRLQTQQLRDTRAAQAARDAALRIAGVTEARANPITGSLIILYDRRRLAPSALWQALCGLGIARGPLPFRTDSPVARAGIGATDAGTAHQGLIGAAIQVLAKALVEHSAAMLLGALI